MKTNRLLYFLAFLFFASSLTAQKVKTPALRGQIITPATANPVDPNFPLGNPMNPNGDGFVTLSGSAFNVGGVAEFELPMFGIPKLGGDVAGDNIGDPCGITDLIPDANGFSVYALRDTKNNLIFRFRVGNNNPSVEAWTILLDTDGLFGIGKDPNATADNPGFELDITLIKRNNAGVFVYNIDGTDKCGTPLHNYSTPTHFQISVADEVSCADPDYFYDFYVPFAEVAADFNASSGSNLDAATGLRYAAVTNTSATCAMDGKLADISGVDNNDPKYSSCTSCAFVDLIEAQCTTPVQDLEPGDVGFNTQLPFTPTINSVKAGATTISGTVFSTLDPPVAAADIDGIYVLVKIYSAAGLLRDSLVASVTNGLWSANLTAPEELEAYDVIRARTQLNPEGTGCGTGSGTEVIFKVLVVPDLTFQTNEDTNLNATLVGVGAVLGTNPIFTLVTPPANGTVTVNPNGTFTYVPTINYNGTDTFTYRLCSDLDDDGSPECGEALVTINIIPVNDGPVANDDVFVTLEETPLNANVSTNDVNIDGPQANYTVVSGPANGILVLNVNGTFTYTPGLDFIGTDQFVYSLCDGATPNLCDQATVQITVNDINDPPVANDDTFTINEDQVLVNTLVTNDNPTDGPQANYTKVSDPLHGTVVVNLNGTFTYTPTANYSGTDQFTYSLCDGANPILCDIATVTITINAVNDAPIANDDAFTIDENQVLSNTVTANDPVDPDGPASNYTLVASTGPTHGVLVFNPNGTFTYTPALDYSGTDTFVYSRCDGATPDLCDQATVTITINSINSSPIANDDLFTINEEEVLTNTVAANDNPTDGPGAIYAKVSDPSHGTVIVNSDGTFTYTPAPDYSGTDQFTYSLCDGDTPNLCDQATVTININPINDPPVITGSLAQTTYVLGGVTIDNTLQVTDVDDTNLAGVVVSISNNFSAGDLLIFTNQGGIAGSYNGATGVLTLTGNASLAAYTAAIASIKFQNDGVVVLTRRITFVANDGDANSLPWNSFIDYPGNNGGPVLNKDTFTTNEDVPLVTCFDVSDPDGDDVVISSFTNISGNNGVFTLNGGVCFTFTPKPEFHGTVTATVTLCDQGVPQICTPYTITITVLEINDPPVANPQTVIVQEDTDTPITLTGTDAESASLTYTVVTGPLHGTLSCLTCSNPTYIPNANYTGPDSFTFKVNDGTTDSNIATVTINVVPLNDPPIAVNDILITTVEDVAVTFKVTTNDTDPDGNGTINPVTVDLDPSTSAEDKTFTVAGEGTYTVDNLGNVTFTPAPNYNGTATQITYTVKDNAGALSNAAPIQVIVTPVNDAPVVTPLILTIDEDQVTSICFTVTDVENDPSVFAGGISLTGNGSLVLDPATGQFCFIYTPKKNYHGQDVVQVTVCDANVPGLCSTGSITININSVNDPPVITLLNGVPGNVLSLSTPEETPVTFCFDVSDEEGNAISVGALTQISGGGTLVSGTNINNQLCFTFTPGTNFNGKAVWEINICDDGNPVACGKLIVEVTVTPVNDAPVAANQSVTIVEDTPTPITLDVTDVDGDVLTYTIITNPAHGTLTVVGSVITYTPDLNYSGPDTFTYKANDGTVDSNVATVSITVTPVNDPPIIKAIAILTTPEDTELPVCLEVSDAEGNVITYQNPTMVSGGGAMTPSTEFAFCYVFMPAKDFNGDAFWKFTVCDNGNPSQCTEVTVQIKVTPVNDPPVAVDDEVTAMSATNTDGVNILANDRDIENDGLVLTVTPISGPYHGTITMNPNGTITYKSDLGYIGTDSVRYQVCDTGIPSLCDEGVVIIVVGPAPFKIYNGLSPNGDNRNDYWRIDGIEAFPNNRVRVFDRYNNLIFETSGYNNDDNSWRGQTNHSMISGSLPEGTYYYSVDLGDGSGLYSGYVVLKKE